MIFVLLVQLQKKKKSLQPSQVPLSSRASIVLPLLNTSNPFAQKRINDDNICKKLFYFVTPNVIISW